MQIKHPKNIFYKMTYLIECLADNTMCYIISESNCEMYGSFGF